MSNNKKTDIQTPNIKQNNQPNDINDSFYFLSPSESPSNNYNHNRIKAYSESNTKTNDITIRQNQNMNMNFSTTFETFNIPEEENNLSLGDKINTIYNESENSSSNNSKNFRLMPSKKPRLSLKDSRTKLKQLRDKLSPYLSEEDKIREQENLLAVPLNKMNDEKYKLLRMHHLKKKTLPEYKSCTKFEDYYKPFEKTFDKKNEFFLLKRKKCIYSNTKNIILEFKLKNGQKEKNFPMYRDSDIGIYEYWEVPLIESKVDEDNDSDEEQINLAKKVCDLDLSEGIKYVQKNGLDDILNRYNKKESKNLNKDIDD